MHEQAPQLVGRVGRSGLCRRLCEPVDCGRDLLVFGTVEHADVERAGDPAVVPLFDRPDPPGAHHAQQAGVDEKVHVVGDGALGAVNRLRHLGDRRGPLEEQLQEGGAQRLGQRAQLLRRGDHDHLIQVVVRDLAIDRHI